MCEFSLLICERLYNFSKNERDLQEKYKDQGNQTALYPYVKLSKNKLEEGIYFKQGLTVYS